MAYWVFKALLSPIFYVLWRVDVVGSENIPAEGPVILAPNHTSFCDSFFLPLVLRRRVTFVAKAEYFDSWKTAWFFRAAGQIPMRREGGSASERALAAARDVLVSGGVLGIYPEGTRSPDGRLYRGHTGVARLALDCGAPVIPVGMTGTTDVQPIGSNIMRPFKRVRISFGRPLDLESHAAHSAPSAPSAHAARGTHAPHLARGAQVADTAADPLVLRRVADELMFEIRELTGQDYVDRYAKRHDVVGGSETATIEPLRPIAGVSFGAGTTTTAGGVEGAPRAEALATGIPSSAA